MPGQPHRRRALLLACSQFADPRLPALRSPNADVQELADVLGDQAGSRYEVTSQVNITSYQARIAIEQFLGEATPRDLHLIYFSGHGIQDARGDLYFAFTDTQHDWPGSTAVSADWVRARMNASRSRSTVVLIDCCFSGAFLRGMRSRAARDANVASLVRDLPEGSGIAVITASGETELSLEDSDDESGRPARPSYFTEAIVTGIGTGAADHDHDGRITVDELYDYVYRRVRAGPSPQRPKKMGFGEGHVVVALAARHSSEPPPPASSSLEAAATVPVKPPGAGLAPVEVRGLLGKVTFDGEWVTVTKNGFGPGMKGSIGFSASEVQAVTVKPATLLFQGYIQFVVRGHPTAPVVRSGSAAGRPHIADPFSMSFARKANDAVADLRQRIEAVLRPGARQPRPAPDAPGEPPRVPRAEQAATDAEIRLADRRRGHRDGTAAATTIPLYAFEGLVTADFDVVRWLAPWRENWRMVAAGKAAPDASVSRWLPPLAQLLGPYAAPAEVGHPPGTPSADYLASFIDGIRESWHAAVRDRLVPPDPPTLARWLREPAMSGQPSQQPPALLTIDDLRRSARKKRRVRAWTVAGRIALWTLTAFFTLMEVAAIAITIAGDWQPNTVASAVTGNLCFGVPFTALTIWGFFEIRRLRRRAQPRRAPREATFGAPGTSR